MRFLRRHRSARVREIPVVALTAHARIEDREDARAAGFAQYLATPVEPAQLVAVLAQLAGSTEPRSA
jgi:CheY-like chemotaxis protein